MDGSVGGAGGYPSPPGAAVNISKMPPLVSALDRVQRMVNSLDDLANQLHNQATRVIGNNAVEPASAPVPDGKLAENAPLLSRLEEALTVAQRNLQRAMAGASRLSEIG